MEAPITYPQWVSENKKSFSPPICNKLMHKGGLSVMFVGGPNSREDFHVDESSEFFLQLEGTMSLPIIEKGQRRIVTISEGEVFLLPPRIPHSPQRQGESLGLVIERRRETEKEFDCLRWYTDSSRCEEVEYENFFACNDLGKDLLNVVHEYMNYKETRPMGSKFVRSSDKKIIDDVHTVVPAPFYLLSWCAENKDELDKGVSLSLFGEKHPVTQFEVLVTSERERTIKAENETFLFQITGSATVSGSTNCEASLDYSLEKNACFVLPSGSSWNLHRGSSLVSLTLILSYMKQI